MATPGWNKTCRTGRAQGEIDGVEASSPPIQGAFYVDERHGMAPVDSKVRRLVEVGACTNMGRSGGC